MVRTAKRTPKRRRISSRTAARLQSAKGRSSPSGVWRRIRSQAAASWSGSRNRPYPDSGPRGPVFRPAPPRSAKRFQMSNTPVRASPTCAAIAS